MRKIYKECKSVLRSLELRIKDLKFEQAHCQHYLMELIYCTLLSYLYDAITILRVRNNTSVPVILRAFSEAYEDLMNLIEDPNYAIQLLYNSNVQQIKDLNSNIKHAEDKDEIIKTIKELKEKNSNILKYDIDDIILKFNTVNKFEFLGHTNNYDVVYRLACSDTHNNIIALERRHLRRENGIYRFVLKYNMDEGKKKTYLILFFILIKKATKLMREELKAKDNAHIKRLYRKIDHLQFVIMGEKND